MKRKACTKCKSVKLASEFSPDKRVKSGLASWCKSCMNENSKRYSKTPAGRERSRRYSKKRYHSPEGKEYYSEYNKTKARKATVRKYKRSKKGKAAQRRYIQNNRRADSARHKVRYAIEKGEMPPASDLGCENCGGDAQHYHHHKGYSKEHAYDVVPLCVPCHANEH